MYIYSSLPPQVFSGMQEDLGVSVDSPIKLVIRVSSVVESHIVRDDDRWFSLPSNDQVTKVTIVSLR